jgi:hypothetical protein
MQHRPPTHARDMHIEYALILLFTFCLRIGTRHSIYVTYISPRTSMMTHTPCMMTDAAGKTHMVQAYSFVVTTPVNTFTSHCSGLPYRNKPKKVPISEVGDSSMDPPS